MNKTIGSVIVGLTLLLAGWFMLRSNDGRGAGRGETPRPGGHPAVSPVAPKSGPNTNGTENAPSPPPASADLPRRPIFAEFNEEAMQQCAKYLNELWAYAARESLKEVDAILAKDGAKAAIEHIRKVLLVEGYTAPKFTKRLHIVDFPDLAIDPAVLRDVDFRPWFRDLQLARLIPYVAFKSGDATERRDAMTLLADIIKQPPDSTVAMFAARSIAPSRSSGNAPVFQPSWLSKDDRRTPYAVMPDMLGNWDPQAKAPEAVAVGTDPYKVPLVPLIRDDETAATTLMDAFRGSNNLSVKAMILEGMAGVSGSERNTNAYLDVMADHDLFEHLHDVLIPLLQHAAYLPQVRETIDSDLASPSAGWILREDLVEQLPSLYPSERHFGDQAASLVGRDGEDMQVRIAAAKALVNYYGGQLPLPEYRDALASFIGDRVARGDVGGLHDVTTQIAQHGLTEFIGIYDQILRQYTTSPPADDPDGKKAAAIHQLQEALDAFREQEVR